MNVITNMHRREGEFRLTRDGISLPRFGEGLDSPKTCVFAIMVVAVMLAVAAVPMASGESEGTSDGWACRITVDGTSIKATYSEDGAPFAEMEQVYGITGNAGSWGYGADGYGPFGSFYAAFDPAQKNEMVCHLDPSDLTKAVDGTDITGKGYNIMWCLAKVYLSLSDGGKTITLASDDSYGGELAPAFTVGGNDYNYLALGVYEATYDGSRLGSVSGKNPQSGLLDNLRTQAKANEMADGSLAQLWNFHQWQLYRLCSLAAMENFDSQTQVGYGNTDLDNWKIGPSKTGTMDGKGPYYGTEGRDKDGVKLFIENAWGSMNGLVDDACVVVRAQSASPGLYIGQNEHPTSDAQNKVLAALPRIAGFGISPSTDATVWGLPTATTENHSADAPDYINTEADGASQNLGLMVGGGFYRGDMAGLSYLSAVQLDDNYTMGSRLVFMLAEDTAAVHTVTFDATGGKGEFPPMYVQQGKQFSMPDVAPSKGGYAFVEWSDGISTYDPGQEATMGRSDVTLTAVWKQMMSVIPVDGQDDPIEVVVEEKAESGSGDGGKSILLIAIVVAIIAELAVLGVSKR